MKKIALLLCWFAFAAALGGQEHVLRIATFASDRSPWVKNMKSMAREVERESGGRLKILLYPGGVAGGDLEVLRKMEEGVLDGAGLTGMGLGEICPEIRVLESPFLFSSYEQVDAATRELSPRFEKKLEEKGFVLLGWTHQGFVHILSQKRLESPRDLASAKPWIWGSDPVAKAMVETFGVSPVPLEINQVAGALKDRTVDTVYMSPLATLFLQWYPHLGYMVDIPVVEAVGGLVVARSRFEALPKDLRDLLAERSARYARKITEQTREFNGDAIEVLRKKRIAVVRPSDEQVREFRARGTAAAQSLVGRLYPEELLRQVQEIESRD